jgi:alpha-D-ribose 1-methylphosphonate 5-triphosphate synthase subunit PhnG
LSASLCLFTANQATGGSSGGGGPGAAASGGAIYCTSGWMATDCTFSGNITSAGSTYSTRGLAGSGGGIYNAGPLTLNRCAIYSNSASGGSAGEYGTGAIVGGDGLGGGIFNAGQLAATNCTVALNSTFGAPGYAEFIGVGNGTAGNALGGGIFNYGSGTLVAMNLTIASNGCSSPAGIQWTNGLAAGFQIGNGNTSGTFSVHNTLIANSGTNSNAYGSITDDGYNICSDGSAGLFSGSSYNYTDPQLAALGYYGGPTLCMALLPTSPAIDNGDINGCPTTDQRGFLRPFGSGPDMGAYEYGSAASTVPYLNMSTTTTNVTLSFSAFPASTYYLQWSTNLTAWANLSTNGPYAVSTFITQNVSRQGVKHCFFRLLLQ